MRLKYFRILILFLCYAIPRIYAQVDSVTVFGKIMSFDYDSSAVCCAYIQFTNLLSGEKYIYYSDQKGEYKATSLSIGNYEVMVGETSKYTLLDTIQITSSRELNYRIMSTYGYLEKINFPKEYIEYQKRISDRYGSNAITIKIDSLIWFGPYLKFIPKIKNNTEGFIYLLQPDVTHSPFDHIITNSKGDTLIGNVINMGDDVGDFTIHDISEADLIEIPPLSEYYYYPIDVKWNDFSEYPSDNYNFKIVYEYTYFDEVRRYSPNNIPLPTSPPQTLIKAKGLTLRGRYESDNTIAFNNAQLIEEFSEYSKKPFPSWWKKFR